MAVFPNWSDIRQYSVTGIRPSNPVSGWIPDIKKAGLSGASLIIAILQVVSES
jgi:hypothetical protein